MDGLTGNEWHSPNRHRRRDIDQPWHRPRPQPSGGGTGGSGRLVERASSAAHGFDDEKLFRSIQVSFSASERGRLKSMLGAYNWSKGSGNHMFMRFVCNKARGRGSRHVQNLKLQNCNYSCYTCYCCNLYRFVIYICNL